MKNLIVGFMVLGLLFVGVVVGNSLQGDIVGCLYGNCKKDGFVFYDIGKGNELGKGKQFWLGFTEYKGKTSTFKEGIMYNAETKVYTYYTGDPKSNAIQMQKGTFRVGSAGIHNGYISACKGKAFALDLSAWQDFEVPNCEKLK